MTRLQDLFHWWNAIYAAPLLFALVYLALANLLGMFTLSGEDTAHTDVDAHAGGHVDADAGVEAHAGADVGHPHADISGGPDAHAHDGHGAHGQHAGHDVVHSSALASLLALFGVGRAPIALIVQVWVLLWGAIGLGLHSILARLLEPAPMLVASVPATFFAATLLTRTVATLIGKYLPPVQTSVWSRQQFVGKLGEVIYPVTETAGTIHLRDSTGTIHRVRARAAHERLEPGQQIIVLGYDPDGDVYTVDDAVKFVERGD